MELKEKNSKETNNKKSNLVNVAVSLGALIVVGIIGVILGTFNGFGEMFSLVKISKDIVIRLLLMIVFVFFASNLILLILKVFREKKGRVGTLSTVFSSLVKYASVLIGFCWGLSIIGVNVSTIFASVGIVALILGFGAESLVADLVTGVFILFENQYNVGDVVEVDGYRGTVYEIGIRTLSLMDAGGNIKIINNSDLKNVINRSNKRSAAICEVGVAYSTDLLELEKKLEDIFQEIKKSYPDVFNGEILYLGVEELGDSAIKLKIKAEVDEKNVFSGRRILNKELKIAFDKEGIVIPFPQLDVHTK